MSRSLTIYTETAQDVALDAGERVIGVAQTIGHEILQAAQVLEPAVVQNKRERAMQYTRRLVKAFNEGFYDREQ